MTPGGFDVPLQPGVDRRRLTDSRGGAPQVIGRFVTFPGSARLAVYPKTGVKMAKFFRKVEILLENI